MFNYGLPQFINICPLFCERWADIDEHQKQPSHTQGVSKSSKKNKKRKSMKKSLIFITMLLSINAAHAQGNNRADTTLLGVYNTGARFTVTRADFGLQTATEVLGEMVRAFDTVKVITTSTDTGRTKQKHSYTQQCNYVSGLQRTPDLFKDKIVLMSFNKDCDVTQVCLLAQRSGAKALMFIHNFNSNGNIKLPKIGNFKDSIRIPVFCVGKDKGEDISALLPSMAGIKTQQPPPNQSVVANDNKNPNALLTKESANPDSAAQITTNENPTNGIIKQGFTVSPNPARNQVNVTYQFPQATDATIEVKAASGQVINRQILRGVNNGNLPISTVDYSNGTYFVTLQYGKAVQTKKLIVRH